MKIKNKKIQILILLGLVVFFSLFDLYMGAYSISSTLFPLTIIVAFVLINKNFEKSKILLTKLFGKQEKIIVRIYKILKKDK
ncbi:hypothetical protein [uncultured Cetobacterium sp.]|uniref:hypothetical protein n=1 Tax=uncultured Cetobacterium sp. TaxID=527638 RepID=UPI00262BA5C6|nr:hypothetical protein [uncultured Cetobacterium sp.]